MNILYSVIKKVMPSNKENNILQEKQALKDSFVALNEEKDNKRDAIRKVFADDPEMCKKKEKDMREAMNQKRVEKHSKEIEKIY